MNLYLRLLITLLRTWFKPAIRIGDSIELDLRVWPNDLDINGHMNNGRYLTILDLALIDYMARAGLLKLALKKGWRPVLGASMLNYRKGLKPFARYRLRFTLVCWDERWSYMKFEFLCGETVMAAGQSKGAILSRRGVVPSHDLYQALGHTGAAPDIPDAIRAWQEAERLMTLA